MTCELGRPDFDAIASWIEPGHPPRRYGYHGGEARPGEFFERVIGAAIVVEEYVRCTGALMKF